MRKKCLFMIILMLLSLNIEAQKVIQMEKDGGVYKISCVVNGAKMKMIFDTGAASVSLSMSMANYLYENDYIKKEDIIGSGQSITADGSIVDHVVINLRDIEISGVHLKNIKATVIEGQNAPLLLGQTAIQALGSVTIEGNRLFINKYKDVALSQEAIEKLAQEALSLYVDKLYYASMDAYSKLRDYTSLTTDDYYRLINSCFKVEQYDKALDYVSEWENGAEFTEADELTKSLIYSIAAMSCGFKGDFRSEISYLEKELVCKQKDGENVTPFDYDVLANAYDNMEEYDTSIRFRKKAINLYLSDAGCSIRDVYNGTLTDNIGSIGRSLWSYAITATIKNDYRTTEKEAYLWIGAAKCGIEDAIQWCKDHNINYKTVTYNSRWAYLFSSY